jgi:hypothetical protein
MVKELIERNKLLPMTTTRRSYVRENITGYATMVKQRLDEGWSGHLMVFIFNQLRGDIRQMNHQMQIQIENTYASLLTRLNRRPNDYGVSNPILIACPDFPVPKHEKKPLPEVVTNDGMHYNGLLFIPPGLSRLKVSIQQHFADNESHYLRDQVLNRIVIEPITHNVDHLTDYGLKGLKANRLPGDEDLLILPKSYNEILARQYRTNFEDQ